MAEALLAILPLVSRVQEAQRLADRLCAPIDRLRGVSVRLARLGLEVRASAATAKAQAEKRDCEADQVLSLHDQ